MNRPIISKELIEYLEKIYPVQILDPNDSLQMIYFMAGHSDVVRHLREIYERQKEVN